MDEIDNGFETRLPRRPRRALEDVPIDHGPVPTSQPPAGASDWRPPRPGALGPSPVVPIGALAPPVMPPTAPEPAAVVLADESTPAGPSGEPPKPPKRRVRFFRHHRGGKVALIALLAVLLVLGATAGTGVLLLNWRLHNAGLGNMVGSDRPSDAASTSNVHSAGDPHAGRAVNILVIGSDSRAGASGGISNDANPGQRSDTTFIAHVSADRSRIDVVSIPRDTLITIPQCVYPDGSKVPGSGSTNQKFNAAFSYGSSGTKGTTASGAACAIKAVEAMSNVRMDAYAVVDFAGFAKIVDAIGGVDIWLPCRVTSPNANNLSLPAGVNHLNGDTATNYARAREGRGLGDGSDLMRIQRQQALFEAVAQKVFHMNILTNLTTLYNFVGAVADSVTTDLGGVLAIAGFAYSMRGLNTNDLTFATLPIAGASDGVNVVLVPAKDRPVWQALANDTPLVDAGVTLNPVDPSASPSATPAPSFAATPPATPSRPGVTPTPAPSAPPGIVSAPLGQC